MVLGAAPYGWKHIDELDADGMMPRVDTVEMLARVLEVTAGWLGFGVSEMATARGELATSTSA